MEHRKIAKMPSFAALQAHQLVFGTQGPEVRILSLRPRNSRPRPSALSASRRSDPRGRCFPPAGAVVTAISGFVVAYNRAALLRTCLRSLRFVDEFIVIDKSSTD